MLPHFSCVMSGTLFLSLCASVCFLLYKLGIMMVPASLIIRNKWVNIYKLFGVVEEQKKHVVIASDHQIIFRLQTHRRLFLVKSLNSFPVFFLFWLLVNIFKSVLFFPLSHRNCILQYHFYRPVCVFCCFFIHSRTRRRESSFWIRVSKQSLHLIALGPTC